MFLFLPFQLLQAAEHSRGLAGGLLLRRVRQVQRLSHGAARAQPGGPIRHLRPQVLTQNRLAHRHTDAPPDGVRPLQASHLPRRQAGKLSDRPNVVATRQDDPHRRLRAGQILRRRRHQQAHSVPRAQEPHWHRKIHEHQHPSGNSFVQLGP